jgi:lipoprotein-anchoring transpeptidase ErfK/SrfK
MLGSVRRRRVATVVAGLVALAVVAAGCGGGGSATLGDTVSTTTTAPPAPTTTAAPSWISTVAEASVPTLQVFSAPDAAAPDRELPNPWVYDPDFPDQTVPQVFLVKEQRPDGWIRVLLPVRPNGSSGWVRASDVALSENPYRIEVQLAAHTITVMRESEVVYQGAIAVGKPSTPTPVGEYYLRILIQTLDPSSVYGPFAYGLSSHSDVLETFAGGDAEIGIHGNDDASVLGSDVTAGCVRMDNEAITMLSTQLPLGTPVTITA